MIAIHAVNAVYHMRHIRWVYPQLPDITAFIDLAASTYQSHDVTVTRKALFSARQPHIPPTQPKPYLPTSYPPSWLLSYSLGPNLYICRKVSVPPSPIQTLKLLPTMRLGSAPTAESIGDLSGMQVPRSPSQYLLTNACAGIPRFAGKYFA